MQENPNFSVPFLFFSSASQNTPTNTGLPAKDDYWLKPAEEEMDISALSLALGATPETVGQATVETGFDAVLEQVDLAGFIPPGAPPGPEPPPDLLVAGEEVEVVEPNAQPQKLDFHPLQKADADSVKPQLSSEVVENEEISIPTTASDTADEAMKWLVGQMSDSFFNTPDVVNGGPRPKGDPTGAKVDPTGSKVDPTGSKEGVYYFCPPGFYDKFKPIDEPSGWCGTDGLYPENGAKPSPFSDNIPDYTGAKPQKPAGPAIDQAVVDGLKVVSVETTVDEDIYGEKPKDSIYGAKKAPELESDVCPAAPEQVGFPKKDYATSRLTSAGSSAETQDDTVKAGLNGSNTADIVRTKPSRESVAEDKAVKYDGAKPIDADTTLAVDKSSGEPTQDRNQSRDKKATSTSESVELTSTKKTTKLGEIEEKKVDDVKKNLHLTSTVNVAAPDLKKQSLKPEEAELVVKQVADKLYMLAAARPRNGVTIHLNPDDLGSITVVIKSVGKMIETQITASDARVSEALDQNRTRLAEAMDSKGYQLQSVSVSQQSGHSTQQDSSSKNWQQSNQEQSQRQNQSGQQHEHRGHHDRHMDQSKANARAWSRRNEGVDLAI